MNRLLLLDISSELRKDATNFLDICNENVEMAPSKPDATNSDFVDFIILVRSKEFFGTPALSLQRENYFIISDINKAKETAWYQSIKKPFQSWNTLRTKAAEQVYTHYFKNKINMDFIDNTVSSEIASVVKKTSPLISWNFTTTFMAIY